MLVERVQLCNSSSENIVHQNSRRFFTHIEADGPSKEHSILSSRVSDHRILDDHMILTCAIMVNFDLNAFKEIWLISNPSISILPLSASMNRKKLKASVDLPLPVLFRC